MKRLAIFISLAIFMASCSEDSKIINDVEPTNDLELTESAEETEAVQDLVDIDFDSETFLTAVKSGTAFTFGASPVTPFMEGESFTFVEEEGLAITDASMDVMEYVSTTSETTLHVTIIDQEFFWISILNQGNKYIISNNAEDANVSSYQDMTYVQPTDSQIENRNNSTYEVDLFIYADRAYRDAPTPVSHRHNVFYLLDASRDATAIISSQVPVRFKKAHTLSYQQLWNSNASIGVARGKFIDYLKTNPKVWLAGNYNTRAADTDIHIGISGYNMSGGNTVWSISPITGFCGSFNDATFMEGSPSTPIATKRRLASLIANSMGAKLNYTTASMMNPYTTGANKEVLLESSKQQIIDKLDASYCVVEL